MNVTGFNGNTLTFPTAAPLASVQLVTITNTGSLAVGNLTATSSLAGNSTAADVSLLIWVTTGSSCPSAPPNGTTTYSGTWAAPTSTWLSGRTLVAAASQSFCFQSTWNGNSADEGLTVSPTITINGSYNSSSTWTANGTQAAALYVPTAQTVLTDQIGVTGTGSTTTSVVSPGISQNNNKLNTNIIDTPGVIEYPSNFCTVMKVHSTSTTAENWSVWIDSSKPPFYGFPLDDTVTTDTYGSNWAPLGYVTAAVVRDAAADSQQAPVYDVDGNVLAPKMYKITGKGDTTAVPPVNGAYVVTKTVTPNYINNTPIKSGYPDAEIDFCIDNIGQSPYNLSPVYPSNLGTWVNTTTGTPTDQTSRLSKCDTSYATPTDPNNTCVYTQITGYYPHFYVGYRYSFDWTALVQASGFTAAQKSTLASKFFCTSNAATSLTNAYHHNVTVQHNTQNGNATISSPQVNVSTSTQTVNGEAHTIYTVTSQGVTDKTGGITEDMVVNSLEKVQNKAC
jgi:hypothetical protein